MTHNIATLQHILSTYCYVADYGNPAKVSSLAMARPKQLTSKQQKFCREVASGKSQADAYRAAYDVGSRQPNAKPETQQAAASRLMKDSMVRARVDQLIASRERGALASAVSAKTLVLQRLREAVEDNDFGVNRIRALELLARCSGMMRTDITVERKTPDDPEALAAALTAKLIELGVEVEEEPDITEEENPISLDNMCKENSPEENDDSIH